jgi:hypothetical protein
LFSKFSFFKKKKKTQKKFCSAGSSPDGIFLMLWLLFFQYGTAGALQNKLCRNKLHNSGLRP